MTIDKFRKLEKYAYELFSGNVPGIGGLTYLIYDDKVSFIIWKKEFANYILNEMTTIDFFYAMDKIANSKSEKYNKWKQRELRDYKIDKVLNFKWIAG